MPQATLAQLYDAGMAVRREVLGAEHVDKANASIDEITRDFQEFITRYAWGSIWTRPGLDRVTRSAITLTALIAAGASHVRTPSDEVWREGDVLSLDSGANLDGYIGDLCRMGVLGPPDAELMDLLGEVEEVQQAARRPIRAGALGREIYDAAEPVLARSRHAGQLRFVAHGMGLISHEAPRLNATGPVPYPADDADRPLRSGMVLSVETTLLHPRRGFIKLEDTVAVTDDGCEGFGDGGRGWNPGGTGTG